MADEGAHAAVGLTDGLLGLAEMPPDEGDLQTLQACVQEYGCALDVDTLEVSRLYALAKYAGDEASLKYVEA